MCNRNPISDNVIKVLSTRLELRSIASGALAWLSRNFNEYIIITKPSTR